MWETEVVNIIELVQKKKYRENVQTNKNLINIDSKRISPVTGFLSRRTFLFYHAITNRFCGHALTNKQSSYTGMN